MDEHSLLLHLALLEERGLLRVSGEGSSRRVRFKHTLIRDEAYGSILSTRLIELHSQVAQVLQELSSERNPETTLVVAEHWLLARRADRALEELLPRATHLILTGHAEALLELLGRVPVEQVPEARRLELDIFRIEAYDTLGRYEEMRAVCENALTLTSDPVTRSKLLFYLGFAYHRLSQDVRALDYYDESLRIAEQNDDLKMQVRATRGAGLAHWRLGDYANAEQFLRRSRDLSLRIGDRIGLARAEFNLANVFRDRGEYQLAIQAAEHALALYQESGHTVHVANALQILGTCYYSAGDREKASQYYERSTQSSRELGDRHGIAVGLCNLGELYQELEDHERAAGYFAQAIEESRALKNDYLLSFALSGLVQVRLDQARAGHDPLLINSLLPLAEEAAGVAARMNSSERLGAAHRMLAQVHAARGDFAQAQVHARQALDLLRQVGHAFELKRAQETYQQIENASMARQGG